MGVFYVGLSFFFCAEIDRLNRFYFERLNNGLVLHEK